MSATSPAAQPRRYARQSKQQHQRKWYVYLRLCMHEKGVANDPCLISFG